MVIIKIQTGDVVETIFFQLNVKLWLHDARRADWFYDGCYESCSESNIECLSGEASYLGYNWAVTNCSLCSLSKSIEIIVDKWQA